MLSLRSGRGDIDDTRRIVPILLFIWPGGHACRSKGGVDVIGRAGFPVARYTDDPLDFVDFLDDRFHCQTLSMVQSETAFFHELRKSSEKVKEKIQQGY